MASTLSSGSFSTFGVRLKLGINVLAINGVVLKINNKEVTINKVVIANNSEEGE